MKIFDLEELEDLINQKYVMVQKHPTADYYIYNYTQITQFEANWNEITTQCRGLILDSNGNIIARPFRKFWNFEEHHSSEIPNKNFKVFDKLDGSMGILYWLNDKPYIASRGSFESSQAKKANEILYSKYYHLFDKLDKSKTYIFEIIFKENRIVVNYGDLEDIILLAIIDKESGEDLELEDIGFPIVKKYDGINDYRNLKSMIGDNQEGFVLLFENNFRVKIKGEEYIRLHRILTNVSNKTVWEYLSNGMDFDELLDRVPDEFFKWLQNTKNSLNEEFQSIESEYKWIYKILCRVPNIHIRSVFASYAKLYRYPSILFNMLDGKDYSKIIWKIIRPEYSKPFANNTIEN